MAANLLALGRARSALDLSPTVDADPYGAIFLAGVRVSEGKPGGAR
jgi:hypothetical protein